ncbi:MAG: hypothetical protein SFY70_05840 [Bacteroidia bacterium]|nr:hypothetical protein [Bacteroidia bacterium]
MATSFTEVIKRNFPSDERLGFYVQPNIPSGITGRVLNTYTRINIPDVVAVHAYGTMLDKDYIVLTDTQLHHEKGSVNLEDLKGATARDRYVDVDVNTSGNTHRLSLKTKDADAAKVLARTLDTLSFQPKADDLMPEKADYSQYSASSLSWLELRDEVMRTIDLLHERFQNGKLSLLEYEEKKADLLSRL